MVSEPKYTKAAFVVYEPVGAPNRQRQRIRFHINPESLTRTVAVQAGQRPAGVESGGGARPPSGRGATPSSGEASADAAATVKESFTVQIRLDVADHDDPLPPGAAGRGNPLPPGFAKLRDAYGIAPEIAAIESLMYPVQDPALASSDKTVAVRATGPRPTVLLVWGPGRLLPVRITSLKIEESVFNTNLYPVRAEIEASLEVLGEAEALADGEVMSAFVGLHKQRASLAEQYFKNTSA